MKKKILIFLLLVCQMHTNPFDNINPNELNVSEITAEDIQNFFNSNTMPIPQKDIIEALLYERGDDKKGIAQDLTRSLNAFYRSFQSNFNPIASMKLGLYAWSVFKDKKDEKNYREISTFFKSINKTPDYFFLNGFEKNIQKDNSKVVLDNGFLGGVFLVMTSKFDRAIDIFQKKDLADEPRVQLWTAFAFLGLNNKELANLFLDKACKNPQASQNIKNFCADKFKRY